MFFSSRALLITRGVEAKSSEEVYTQFLEHFIETGLIAASFREVVSAAKCGNLDAVFAQEPQAHNLADAVQALYETMDNTFNFKAPLQTQANHEKNEICTATKDLRGVLCPLNFAKTKIELSKLKSGELLEIWLDDGEPIENVPGSVKAEGHRIIAQNKTGGYWSVIIEKK